VLSAKVEDFRVRLLTKVQPKSPVLCELVSRGVRSNVPGYLHFPRLYGMALFGYAVTCSLLFDIVVVGKEVSGWRIDTRHQDTYSRAGGGGV